MSRPAMRQQDDVTAFLRYARDSATRTEAELQRLSAKRSAAATRTALHEGGAGTIDLHDELLAGDEELQATAEELRAQIDALTRACALLERERSKYMDLFAHAPDAYVITDLRGITHDANVAAGLLFSVEPNFLAGRPLITFVARQDTRRFRTFLQELGTSRGLAAARTLTLRMRPRGQLAFVACAHVGVVAGVSGAPVAVRWMLRRLDATETSTGKTLADDELARMLSEDLRRPLTAIVGLAQSLRMGTVRNDDERELALSWIEQSAIAQQTKLDELAELRDMYGEDDNPSAEIVDLRSCVDRAFGAQPASARAELVLPNTPVLTRVDPKRLGRALDLLLQRALAGTPQNGVLVRMGASVEDGHTIVTVQAPEGAQVPAGWGVRMATVERIVEIYGGRLVLSDDSPSARLYLPAAAV
jgi:signal transduction histidine kinase